MKTYLVNRFFYPDISATSQILTDAAHYLADNNHDVHVVTSRLRYDVDKKLPASERVVDVQVHRVWTTRFGRTNIIGRSCDYLSFYLAVFVYLLFNLELDDIVVAKTDPPLVSIPVSWISRLKGATHINWLQDFFPEVAEELGVQLPEPLVKLLKKLRDASLKTADMNIAIGEQMRARIVSAGIPQGRVMVVPNWADDTIKPSAEANGLRSRWGLDEPFVVGYSGNLGRAHEYQTVLGAVRALRNDPGIVFLFIGGGMAMDELRAIVRRENLENIVFKPYQPREQLNESLNVPDVHLTILKPALEGLIVPSKFYGVLAAGKPSLYIGDPSGELGSLIEEQELGYVVGTGDVSSLVDALQALRSDVTNRLAIGARARAYYEENLGFERSAASLNAVFDR